MHQEPKSDEGEGEQQEEERAEIPVVAKAEIESADQPRVVTRRSRATDKRRKAKGGGRGGRFVPRVSPNDYHRFIYKCHECLLGFKRRGMLVNHLAKRHPGVSPETVPELNLPILKATKDYYCQYCSKVSFPMSTNMT